MGVQITPFDWAIFRWKDISGHIHQYSAVSCAKITEPIEMPFRLWTQMGPRKNMEVHIGTIWRIWLSCPCAAAMRPFCQITLITYYYYCVQCFFGKKKVPVCMCYTSIQTACLYLIFTKFACSMKRCWYTLPVRTITKGPMRAPGP